MVYAIVGSMFFSCGTSTPKSSNTDDGGTIGEEICQWKIHYEEDEFGDKTNRKSVYAAFEGTFSDSYTYDGAAILIIRYFGKNLKPFILLAKNGHLLDKDKNYKMKVKSEDGTVYTFDCDWWTVTNNMRIHEPESGSSSFSEEKFDSLIRNGEKLKIFIQCIDNYDKSTFNFIVDGKGLIETLNKYFEEK